MSSSLSAVICWRKIKRNKRRFFKNFVTWHNVHGKWVTHCLSIWYGNFIRKSKYLTRWDWIALRNCGSCDYCALAALELTRKKRRRMNRLSRIRRPTFLGNTATEIFLKIKNIRCLKIFSFLLINEYRFSHRVEQSMFETSWLVGVKQVRVE